MKKIIMITVLMVSVSMLYSQEKGHYVSLGGILGSSGYKYELQSAGGSTVLDNSIDGSVSRGFGFGGKLGYSYFFTPYLGVGSGFSVSFYNTTVDFSNYSITFSKWLQDDHNQDDYRRRVILEDWKCVQKTTYGEIPLLLQFQYKFGDQFFGIYANAGVKVQLPLSSKYEITEGNIETRGRYRSWSPTESDPVEFKDMPNHGYGIDGDFHPSGDVDVKLGFAATASIGALIAINRTLDVYAGAYLDYGFTDIKKQEEGSIVYLDDQDQTQYRSLLSSTNVGTINPISVGAELGVRFKFGGSSLETREQVMARRASEKEAELAKAEIKRLREEAREKREDEQAAREAKADKQADEMTNSMKRIEALLTKAVELKNAEVERVQAENNKEAVKVNFDADILFDFGKSVLSKGARESLVGLVQLLQEDPNTLVDILGHTDNISSLEFNQRLSTQRAQAVANYLTSMGVSSDQIGRVVGKNYSQPIADNETEEGRAKNRRVEILIYADKK